MRIRDVLEVFRCECSAGQKQLRAGMGGKPVILVGQNLDLTARATFGEKPLEFIGFGDRYDLVLCAMQHQGWVVFPGRRGVPSRGECPRRAL